MGAIEVCHQHPVRAFTKQEAEKIDARMHEFACREGSYSIAGMLKGGGGQEKLRTRPRPPR